MDCFQCIPDSSSPKVVTPNMPDTGNLREREREGEGEGDRERESVGKKEAVIFHSLVKHFYVLFFIYLFTFIFLLLCMVKRLVKLPDIFFTRVHHDLITD